MKWELLRIAGQILVLILVPFLWWLRWHYWREVNPDLDWWRFFLGA